MSGSIVHADWSWKASRSMVEEVVLGALDFTPIGSVERDEIVQEIQAIGSLVLNSRSPESQDSLMEAFTLMDLKELVARTSWEGVQNTLPLVSVAEAYSAWGEADHAAEVELTWIEQGGFGVLHDAIVESDVAEKSGLVKPLPEIGESTTVLATRVTVGELRQQTERYLRSGVPNVGDCLNRARVRMSLQGLVISRASTLGG